MSAGESEKRYSIQIEFYNYDPLQSRPLPTSPLLPRTPTLLPPPLDRDLRAAQPRLCLPKSFWQHLPPSKPLDTFTLPTPFSPAVPQPPPLHPHRAWSESGTGPQSPPAIATADLFVPSQAQPTGQTATLDFRFGPLTIDWVDDPDAYSHRPPMSPPLSPIRVASPPLYPLQSLPLTTKSSPQPGSSSSSAIANGKAVAPPERSGSTELYWGTVHLYRELGAEESTEKDKTKAVSEDDGTVVGMVSVPGIFTAASLLAFISPALDSVAQLRLLRDSTPNRTMVLIRFREAADAAQFRVMYNGKPYHETKDSEVCHVVSISEIKLKSSTTPPFTFPYSPDLETKAEDQVELPTCPVCLERMDSNTTGLVTVLCQHSFHCNCLLKWGDSRCPVCRSTHYRTRKATLSTPTTSRCAICQSPSNLWICLICGNVGCGRYQGGHAHSHFSESGHSYSMELETQRVWDYVTDSYVHRLIRDRADGKLVELPSLTSKSDEKDKEKDKSGPDRDTEESQDKLEAMGIEYANLMTSQLDSQRGYYEEEIGRVKDEVVVTRRKWEEASTEAGRWRREKGEVEKRLEEESGRMRREKEELAAKLEQVEKSKAEEDARRKKEKLEAAKARKDIERQLEAERAVTTSLTENLGHLRVEVTKRDEESRKLKEEIDELKEQMRDVMFALSARDQIEAEGGAANEAAGGSVSVPTTPSGTPASRRRKKK